MAKKDSTDQMDFFKKPPVSETVWHARRYMYSDGGSYRPNCYLLYVPDPRNPGQELQVGGAISLRNTSAFAYIGAITPIHRVRTIMLSTRYYVFGVGLRDALFKLKTTWPNPLSALETFQPRSREKAS